MPEQEEENKEVTTETPKKPKDTPPDKPYKKGDYLEFVKFYAMTSIYKLEKFGVASEKDFAKKFNLSQDTLVDWKKRKEFKIDVDNKLMKWGGDQTPDVLQALLDKILEDGKAAEVKLWYQIVKGWKEGMILEQPSIERDNKLSKLLENADDNTKRKFAELLKTILPDSRESKE